MEQCPLCLRHIQPIPSLQLTTKVTDRTGTTTFVEKGIVDENLIVHVEEYLTKIKKENGNQHVFEVLGGVLHRQITFQVFSSACANEKRHQTFQVTRAFFNQIS